METPPLWRSDRLCNQAITSICGVRLAAKMPCESEPGIGLASRQHIITSCTRNKPVPELYISVTTFSWITIEFILDCIGMGRPTFTDSFLKTKQKNNTMKTQVVQALYFKNKREDFNTPQK